MPMISVRVNCLWSVRNEVAKMQMMSVKRLRRRRETKSGDCSERRMRGLDVESKQVSTRLKTSVTLIETSLRRLLWVKPSPLRKMSCLISVCSTRQLDWDRALEMMKTTICMISLCLRTERPQVSTRTSIEKLARATWQINLVTTMAKIKVALMSSKCSDKHLVGLLRAEQTPQLRIKKEVPRSL